MQEVSEESKAVVSPQEDPLSSLLARMEVIQTVQNKLQAEQQSLQAEQLQLFKDLTQGVQTSASHKLVNNSSGSWLANGRLHRL